MKSDDSRERLLSLSDLLAKMFHKNQRDWAKPEMLIAIRRRIMHLKFDDELALGANFTQSNLQNDLDY